MPHCSGHRPALRHLKARLRRNSLKFTGARAAILNALRRSAHPLSIKDLFSIVGRGQCDLATIYRSMHLLEGMGMVKRFDFGDGAARFELLKEGDDGHHHHLVCTRCAEVVELEDCSMTDLENKIAQLNGYRAVTHKLEFFGVCPSCQS